MSIRAADALSAYAQATKQLGPGLEAPTQPTGAFKDLLKDVAADAIQAGRQADKMTAAAVDGEAGVTEVVTALANAEITLQTVVAVRDRVVQAYQEILRMPI